MHTLSVFVVTSSEVRLGLVFSALERQKLANFPWAEPKPLEIENFILTRKIAVRPPEKHFLIQWYVNSYSFGVFRIIRWAEESVIACTQKCHFLRVCHNFLYKQNNVLQLSLPSPTPPNEQTSKQTNKRSQPSDHATFIWTIHDQTHMKHVVKERKHCVQVWLPCARNIILL